MVTKDNDALRIDVELKKKGLVSLLPLENGLFREENGGSDFVEVSARGVPKLIDMSIGMSTSIIKDLIPKKANAYVLGESTYSISRLEKYFPIQFYKKLE